MLYYGSRISENMTKTPEGYLICMNVPINRTGSQTYLGSELQLDERNGNERIEIIRDSEQVFDKATLASFEGKPVCDEHPNEDVDISNNDMYQVGHCQNVRQQGDYTIADLYITNPQMINEIENGKREISCGYTCDFVPNGDGTYKQVNIRGNHIAVVNSGRAGESVRINDSQVKDDNYDSYFYKIKNIQYRGEFDYLKRAINSDSQLSADDKKGLLYYLDAKYNSRIQDSSINDASIDKVINENKYAIMYRDKNGKYCVKKKKDNSIYEYQTPNKAYTTYHRITEIDDSDIEDDLYFSNPNILEAVKKENKPERLKYLKAMIERSKNKTPDDIKALQIIKEKYLDYGIKDSSIDDGGEGSGRKTNGQHIIETVNKKGKSSSWVGPNNVKSWDQLEEERRDKNQEDSKGVNDMSYKQQLREIRDFDYAKELRKIKDNNFLTKLKRILDVRSVKDAFTFEVGIKNESDLERARKQLIKQGHREVSKNKFKVPGATNEYIKLIITGKNEFAFDSSVNKL